VSCPDWHSLVAERDASGDDAPAYHEALAHLEGCPRCREAAYDADPLLVFRRLPAPKAAVADIEAMRQAVATLRRTREMTGRTSERVQERPEEPRSGAGLWARLRWSAAAAALLALSLALAPSAPRSNQRAEQLASAPGRPSLGLAVNSLEDLSLPDARVYELAEAELQVVMVVDPSLNL
jgi:hypothetical protein